MTSRYQTLHRLNSGASSCCPRSVIMHILLFLIPVGDQRRHGQSDDQTNDQAKGRPLDKTSYYQANDDGRHYGNIPSTMHVSEPLLLI